MKTNRNLFSIATLLISLVSTLAQSPPVTNYNALYVFGASWSDTRNNDFPASLYWRRHWSNGPMWPEFLSTNLGLTYMGAKNLAVPSATSGAVLSQVTNFRPAANPELGLC